MINDQSILWRETRHSPKVLGSPVLACRRLGFVRTISTSLAIDSGTLSSRARATKNELKTISAVGCWALIGRDRDWLSEGRLNLEGIARCGEVAFCDVEVVVDSSSRSSVFGDRNEPIRPDQCVRRRHIVTGLEGPWGSTLMIGYASPNEIMVTLTLRHLEGGHLDPTSLRFVSSSNSPCG